MTESTRDGTYLKLPVKRYAPKTIRETAEGRYWRAYKSTGLVNQVSQVTSVHFADAYPHQLAVTSSARVSIFSSQSRRSTREPSPALRMSPTAASSATTARRSPSAASRDGSSSST